ncbi:CU044_2847 family protein [Saccharothrix longispora]|uniref:CU044_2847 family protein n=1 Tax=Saccharothrix longispora TaxID=33920 RepID=UPI0028FD56D3|nr:CU044_2847 family protein [Saccharothrix longispora]MDU0290156.1 CU044_2847 family protein [Saccharothrix longispora]
MTEYVEVRTEDGGLVPFELDEEYDGPVRAGRRWDRVEETLEQGVERARQVARSVARKIGDMPSPRPDKVAVEIGLKAGVTGAFGIARSSAEAHVKITVEWHRDGLDAAPPAEDGESRPKEAPAADPTGADPAGGV